MSEAEDDGTDACTVQNHDSQLSGIEHASDGALAHSSVSTDHPSIKRMARRIRDAVTTETRAPAGTDEEPTLVAENLPALSQELSALMVNTPLASEFALHCRKNAGLLPIFRRYTEQLHAFLGWLYVLSMEFSRGTELRDNIFAAIGVRQSQRGPKTPHHKMVVRAALVVMGAEKSDSTEDDWATALWALQLSDVVEDAGEAEKWFAVTVVIGGERASGLRRARLVVAQGKRPAGGNAQPKQSRKSSRLSARDHKSNRHTFEPILQAGKDQPLGIIESEGDTPLPDEPWISLNHGSHVLRQIRLTQSQISKIVVQNEWLQ